MIDMNDPEIVESLKYLLVPKSEKIRMAAMPYSSTKNFFVPCKEEGYECAEITDEDGDNITLMTRKKQGRQFQKRSTFTNEPSKIRNVRRYGRFDLLERRHRLPQFT